MQTLHDTVTAATSYIVAILTMFGVLITDHSTGIVQFLGFVLLVARLAQEIPAAWFTIRGFINSRRKEDDG